MTHDGEQCIGNNSGCFWITRHQVNVCLFFLGVSGRGPTTSMATLWNGREIGGAVITRGALLDECLAVC